MNRADWDARYAAGGAALFGAAPNDHLRGAVGRMAPRPTTALALADGDGRNGRWLAAQGMAVTAVDLSPVATRQATEADIAAGVSVARIAADLTEWTPPPGARWSLAALIYLQGPAALRLHALRLAAAAVAPGGWLALEGFAADAPDGAAALGPRNDVMRWRAAEVAPLLDGFEVLALLTGQVALREGAHHDGAAWALRLLARRPATASGRIAP